MKVIILTQYFPPETGAPQNRLFAIAQGLKAKGAKVTVITGMPNYPEMRVQEKYRGKFFINEKLDGLTVLRCWLYVPKSKRTILRLLNYFSFMKSSFLIGLFKAERADVVITESPPLFLGITGVLLAKLKGAKHVFNVSDLWPESAVQLGIVTNRTVISAATRLEMWCYRRSAMITGQTMGIVNNITARCPSKKVIWIPNGADLNAIDQTMADPRIMNDLGIGPHSTTFVYAGVLGHAQGLEVILKAALILQELKLPIHFLLIGSGPEEDMLKSMIEELGLTQVLMLGRLNRKETLGILSASTGAVVPLRKKDLFKGAIPSKIFESLALGKPILLGVDGEARDLFIEDHDCGLYFEPDNAQALADAARKYHQYLDLAAQHGATGQAYVRASFDRDKITDDLWKALISLKEPRA